VTVSDPRRSGLPYCVASSPGVYVPDDGALAMELWPGPGTRELCPGQYIQDKKTDFTTASPGTGSISVVSASAHPNPISEIPRAVSVSTHTIGWMQLPMPEPIGA
jgi:hypothetical protein